MTRPSRWAELAAGRSTSIARKIALAKRGVAVGVATALVATAAAIGVPSVSAGVGCSAKVTLGNLSKCVIAHASGHHGLISAKGRARGPASIALVVYTKPRQEVQVAWAMVCRRGLSARTSSDGFRLSTVPPSSSGGVTPTGVKAPWTLKTLTMPIRRPSGCRVSANAQLSSGGWLLLQILAVPR